MKKIIVTDATLKNGEAANSFTFREKLNICALLDGVGVDLIVLPGLGNSDEDAVICRTLAKSVKNAVVAIETGDDEQSMDEAYDCVAAADKPALIVSLPVSTATMEYGYHLKASAMLEKIKATVARAKSLCGEVMFVARDAFRADEGFIEQVAVAARESGASSVTVCDDAGEAFPSDYAAIVKRIKAVSDIQVIVDPSDALCLAVACAVEAIEAGADGVVTTVIGSGVRPDTLANLFRAKGSELSAAIGVDITKAKSVAESITDTSVSATERAEQSVTALSSSSTLKDVSAVIKELGYELSDEDTGKVYDEFKRVALNKSTVEAKEIEAIVAVTAMQAPSTYHLVSYVVNSGSGIAATANVTMEKDGVTVCGLATGDGPIDAAFHAIEQVVGHHYELDDFQIHAVTKGREAVGSSIIKLRANGKLYPGNGVSTDIVGACIRAYINSLNKIVYEEN